MKLEEGLKFVENIEELSAMPSIALDLMSMLNDPSSTVKFIVEKVKLDQALISYILKNCNSPLYGIRNEVTSVAMAINLLGFSNLKSIMMAYFMRNLFKLSGNDEVRNYLWRHSIAVAVFAKILAGKLNANTDEAYLAGLLHDMGKMVLNIAYPKEYEKVVKDVKDFVLNFVDAEQKYIHLTHMEAGYFIMVKWKFSEALKEVAQYHHEAEFLPERDKLVPLIAFADKLALIFVDDRGGDVDLFMRKYNLQQTDIDKIVAESLQLIETYITVS
ncbi:MAG: HDOD domain-containing protein [bacterium]|nr:HDOD domain-containing protein [bacterium]